MRTALAVVTAMSLASPVLAQTGVMYLSHSKLSGEVVPGETIRFEMRLDWTGGDQILLIRGNVRGTPDIGLIISSYGPCLPGRWPNPWGALTTQGSLIGASIFSFEVGFTPSFYGGGFVVPSPSKTPLLGNFLTWDWTAPDVDVPTIAVFTYEPDGSQYGGVWYNGSYTNPHLLPLPITIVSAPIVIDPSNLYCIADLTTTATPGQPGHGVPDGELSSEDFFYYLAAFVASDPQADLTHAAIQGTPGFGVANGAITGDDFFYYLTLYSMGC